MTGYHVGAVATALLAIFIVPDWRLMFIIGGVAGLVLLPFLWAKLPESLPEAAPAQAGGSRTGAAAKSAAAVEHSGGTQQKTGFRDLLQKPYPLVAVGIGIASFMGLLLVYGLNTWLPQLMAASGYPVSTGMTPLLVLNAGAAAWGCSSPESLPTSMGPRRSCCCGSGCRRCCWPSSA